MHHNIINICFKMPCIVGYLIFCMFVLFPVTCLNARFAATRSFANTRVLERTPPGGGVFEHPRVRTHGRLNTQFEKHRRTLQDIHENAQDIIYYDTLS